MEVDGWGGRKMHDAMSSTTQGGGIRLCGMNALRDAAEGEGGFFFSGPIRLGVPRAQVWRETLERSGRLHDISAALDRLKRIGVRRVCWLRPNEEVTPHEGVWANGGFAFFYDNPSFDCIFKLSKVMPPSRRGNRGRRQSIGDPQTAAFTTTANPQTADQSEASAQLERSPQRGAAEIGEIDEASDGSDRNGSPGARSAAPATDPRRRSASPDRLHHV